MLKNLWMDQGGALLSMEFVLLATILVIGVIVGLSAVQDAVVTELADVGGAIAALSQSYSSGGATGHHASTAGQGYQDLLDSCDDGHTQNGTNSRCVAICTNIDCEATN